MKTLKFLALAILLIGFTSCSSDDDNSSSVLELESETVLNLHAPQEGGQGEPTSGEFTKFSFSTGTITTSETEWDIAFRGTSIILNGGVTLGTTDEPERSGNAAGYIADGTLASITEVNTELLVEDTEEGYAINGWYTYSGPPNHLITPTAGKVIVIKTHDGKYAKVEILSYYKDAPDNLDAFVDESRYYTFNYVYQPNLGDTTF